MRYQRSYLFIFQSPQWSVTVLSGGICLLIPLVGWTVFLGYVLDLLEAMQEHGDQDYPAFDINRVGHYMTRGLWPIIAQLFALFPVIVLASLGFTMLLLSAETGKPSPLHRFLATGIALCSLFITLIVGVMMLPLTLFIGLRQSGELMAGWQFAQDFVRHVWKELLLAQFFVMTTGLSLFFLGLLACGLGAGPALALVGYSQYHLLNQLYGLYLERGGMPVPVYLAEAPVPTP